MDINNYTTFGLGYFVFKFSKSNVLTKEAQENLEDVEQEFEIIEKNP